MPFCVNPRTLLSAMTMFDPPSTRNPFVPPLIVAFSTATLRACITSTSQSGGFAPASITAPEKSTTTSCPLMVRAVSACNVRLITVTWAGPAAAISSLSCERCVPSKVSLRSGCCTKFGRIARFAVTVSFAPAQAANAVPLSMFSNRARWYTCVPRRCRATGSASPSRSGGNAPGRSVEAAARLGLAAVDSPAGLPSLAPTPVGTRAGDQNTPRTAMAEAAARLMTLFIS